MADMSVIVVKTPATVMLLFVKGSDWLLCCMETDDWLIEMSVGLCVIGDKVVDEGYCLITVAIIGTGVVGREPTTKNAIYIYLDYTFLGNAVQKRSMSLFIYPQDLILGMTLMHAHLV